MENGTKVVSFRLPMPDYVKLIQEAADRRLSVSDYVIVKLSTAHAVGTVEELQRQHRREVEALQGSVAQAAALRQEIVQLQAEFDAKAADAAASSAAVLAMKQRGQHLYSLIHRHDTSLSGRHQFSDRDWKQIEWLKTMQL